MNWLINVLWKSRAYNDAFALLLYWLPMAANALAYTIRVYQRVQSDKAAIRDGKKYYGDWMKLGDLIGYAAATVFPLVNLCMFVFDTMVDLWKMVWSHLGWLFNMRIVPGSATKDDDA